MASISVPTAIVGAGVLGAGASVLGSSNAASASEKAAQTQADAANQAAQLQKEIFDVQNSEYAPWRTTGANALNQMNALMGLPQVDESGVNGGTVPSVSSATAIAPMAYNLIGPNGVNYPLTAAQARQVGTLPSGYSIVPAASMQTTTPNSPNALFQPGNTSDVLNANRTAALNSFYTDPGYQFSMDQGIQAIDRSAAARGILNSGATAKALDKFGQGLANQQYGTYYNRLAGLSGTGQTATNETANAAGTYGTNAGNELTNAGNARASGYIGAANAFNSGLSGVGNSINGALNNYFAYNGLGNSYSTLPANSFMSAGDAFSDIG